MRRQYEQREKAIMDYNSAVSAAQRMGLKAGLEQGLQQGCEQGREEGKRQAVEQTAVNLLWLGMDIHMMQKATGLGMDDLEKLKIKA